MSHVLKIHPDHDFESMVRWLDSHVRPHEKRSTYTVRDDLWSANHALSVKYDRKYEGCHVVVISLDVSSDVVTHFKLMWGGMP